jgi:hypothetical protein
VLRAIAEPGRLSDQRHRVAEDLFHRPGSATARAVTALYEAIELDPAIAAVPRQEEQCQPSA